MAREYHNSFGPPDRPTAANHDGRPLDDFTDSIKGVPQIQEGPDQVSRTVPGRLRPYQRLGAAAVLPLTVVVAACAAPRQDTRPHTPTLVPTSEDPMYKSDHLNHLNFSVPKALPPAVAEAEKSTVDVGRDAVLEEIYENGLVVRQVEQNSLGSGVKIGGNEFLTAGHVLALSEAKCGDMEVVGKTDGIAVDGKAIHDAASYGARDYEAADIGLLQVDPSNLLTRMPDAKIAETPPRDGEIVYFVNFQPERNGTDRIPNAFDPAHQQPAVYPGVVLNTNNEAINVATNMGSYGAIDDDETRPGASGGAVFNQHGEVAGVAVRADQETYPKHNWKNFGYDNDISTRITYVQPVTAALVEKMEEVSKNHPECPQTPPIIIDHQ